MKNLIIWLEDQPIMISDECYFLESKGFEVKVISSATVLTNILKNEYERICLIILDIMLFSPKSFRSIGLDDISTDFGYNAGLAIAEFFLREETSKYKDIPILFVSMKPLNEEGQENLQKLNNSGAWVDYLQKGTYDSHKFDDIIRNYLNR